MAEPIDYLKTYLNIDPMDYSAMEAQIAGEPLPEREVFTMPSYRPQVDLSQMQAMPMQPMAPTQPSGDSRLQSLMDEISALKSQIAELESAQATPVSDVPATRIVDELTKPKPDKTITTSPALPEGIAEGGRYFTGPNGERMYQPPMPKVGPGQFQTMVMPPAINLDTGKPLDFGGEKLTIGASLNDALQNLRTGQQPQLIEKISQPNEKKGGLSGILARLNEKIRKQQPIMAEGIPMPTQDLKLDADNIPEGMTLFGQPITPDSFGGEPTRKGFAMATARPDLPPANVRGPFGFINNKQPSSGGSIGEAIRNLTLKFPKAQMQSVRLPNQVRADSSTTPYSVIQDQSLPSLPSRDVARNVLDTQMMYRPMQFAGGGSLDKALQNLKSQLRNG